MGTLTCLASDSQAGNGYNCISQADVRMQHLKHRRHCQWDMSTTTSMRAVLLSKYYGIHFVPRDKRAVDQVRYTCVCTERGLQSLSCVYHSQGDVVNCLYTVLFCLLASLWRLFSSPPG